MADWEEVKRLAADFQRAQLSSSVQKLSERNCIEIINKLIKEKLLDVFYTTDGKEYITPDQLLREIKDELYVEGGRIHLSELSKILDVDYSHIEAKSTELVKHDKNIYLILGQLVDRTYVNRIFEEINDKLQQNGQICVADLTKQYDLPSDFLQQMLRERLGTIVKGQSDPEDSKIIFTQAFIDRHKCHIRGALTATTKPTNVHAVINRYGLQPKIFFNVLEEILANGQLNGILSGGKNEKSGVFIPDIYAKAQNEWVDNFYKQNNYLGYDVMNKLGIGDPENFIRKKYKKESIIFLESCAIGKTILEQVESGIETAVANNSWVDVTTLCPSFLSEEDVQQVVQTIWKQSKTLNETATIYCETVVSSNQILQTLAQPFQELMVEKAEQARTKGSFSVDVLSDTKSKGPGDLKKESRKEERRKKASSGKAGSGTQGRETKTKSTKKKYMKGRDSSGESDDESGKASSTRAGEIPFMTTSEIEKVLVKQEILEECPKEFAKALSELLYGPLRHKYQEIARSIFMGSLASNSGSRKSHSEVQEKINGLMGNVYMFVKGIEIFTDENLKQDLRKYLLKTVCANVVNYAVGYIAQENMLSADSTGNLTLEQRNKLISKLPTEVRDKFNHLNITLNGKTVDEFLEALDATLASDVCDIVIKKLDKKKEKLNSSNHYQSLLLQLSEANEPALVLHLTVLILFYKATNLWINASGKFVPQILEFLQLQGHLEQNAYQLLHSYQGLIVKQMTHSKNNSESDAVINNELNSTISSIKEIAISYKNKSQK